MSDATYAKSVWAFFRGAEPKPEPAAHEIDPRIADAVYRQCEHERKVKGLEIVKLEPQLVARNLL